MDKILKLYQIPEQDSIVNVVGVFGLDETLPAVFEAGDLAIWNDGIYGYRLWNVVEIYGELEWIDMPFDADAYYRDTSEQEPKFYQAYEVSQGNWNVFEQDFSFPDNGRAAVIDTFTYSAGRMGNAPTITATLMHRQCLDELWTDRVCTFFNGVFYFIDKIPTSEYSNADQRYKHSLSFTSERILLENVYFINTVDGTSANTDTPASLWLEFSFFDNIAHFAARLNESLKYSGLYDLGFKVVVDDDAVTTAFINSLEEPMQMISISETTLKAALDLIYETWEVPYYFDGYTIHIGFSNNPQMYEAGVVMPTFQYGATDSLLSIQKNQNNNIINRVTGLGGSDNLPYFYPNKNPNGLDLIYVRGSYFMEDYARIANPYRLVNVSESTVVVQGVPDGTYFKYMPITKTYTYDQFVTINEQERIEVEYDGDTPLVVATPILSDYCRSKFYKQNYGGIQIIGHAVHPEYVFICKTVWMWLRDGETQNLTIRDEMNPIEQFRKIIAGTSYRIYIKAKTHTYTREQFEYFSENSESYDFDSSANLIDRYCQETFVSNHRRLKWDNDTVTEGYSDVLYPASFDTLPSGTTCVSFTVGIKLKRSVADANGQKVLITLKDGTRTSATQTYLSSTPDWSKNGDGHAITGGLYRYGLRINDGVTPENGDIIYFVKESGWLPYASSLIPYHFRNTSDIWLNALNNTYLKEGSQTEYYSFPNIYKQTCAKEAVRNHEDIHPTIKGMTNNQTPSRRIDRISAVMFDANDNNEKTADGTAYQHPYFFVKLARTSLDNGYGFNLFDCAIEGETMKISFTSGHCGGCSFEVMVKYGSDGFARNPIGVFEEATTINGVTYAAGTPKRDLNTGDVLLNRYESAQQNTSAAEVWIALKKDADTFPDTVLPNLSQDRVPTTSDNFVILNINLPYAYVVAAEQKLYYALLDDLEEENPRKWSFNIKFSSIYYKHNYALMDKWLNESSLVPFRYNNILRSYYVQSYTYKMTNSAALPEVTIELQEKPRKRNNGFYPVPYNPFAVTPAQSTALEKQMKQIINSVLATAQNQSYPQSAQVDDLQVLGDVTLSDGTSLNAQIAAINSRFQSDADARTREYAWSEVSKRAEIENLFIDGIFATDYNKENASSVRIQHNDSGVVGDNSMKATFEDNNSYFTFEQEIHVDELAAHTVAFYAKTDTTAEMTVTVSCYDDSDTFLEDFAFDFDITDSWSQKAASFTTPEGASYIVLKFAYSGDDTVVSIDIDGISVYADNFMTYDQEGNAVPSTLLPEKYRMGAADIFNAIEKLGGGGISDIFWCTLSGSDNALSMNKTPQEIYEAYQSGKFVVCVHAPYFMKLTYISPFEGSYLIHFESIHRQVGSYYEIHYASYNTSAWVSSTGDIQERLVGSGTGQNIKTVNGNNLLGSGDVEIQAPLYNGTRIMIDSNGLHTVDLTDYGVTIINFADGVTSVQINFTLNAVGDREVVLNRAVDGSSVNCSINEISTNLSNKGLRCYTSSANLNSNNPRTFTIKCRKIDSDVYFLEGSSISIYSSYGALAGATWTPPSE